MCRTIRTTLLALSLLALHTSVQAAPESKPQKSQNKRIASASLAGAKDVKTNKKAGKQKRQIATSLPPELMQNDRATLSDDEITRIKLIKRYEGVPNPRTDWSNGLRTLNWHYTENSGE